MEKEKKINKEALLNIAKTLKVHYENKPINLIIVYSIGSAHGFLDDLLIKHKKIKNGTNDKIDFLKRDLNFSRAQLELMDIQEKFGEVLLEAEIPFFNVHSSNIFNLKNNRVNESNTKVLSQFLKINFLPIACGGLVFDGDKGFDYLPGDNIVFELAEKMKPEILLFGTDVDGIFEDNPKQDFGDVDLISTIKLRDIPKVIRKLSLPVKSHQSSSDIRRKLDNIAIALDKKWIKKAFIFNINNTERLNSLLKDEETLSTKIIPN